ncbi:uncharacterized protein LOC143293681 [Babylonia areolata]|uniref:uncharacterized protein LOC143293681 n=1 Tax=Babylonia areolata TaxID=304850 RepID=UPI003FD0893B
MAATVSGAFPVCLEQDRANTEDGEAKKKQVALMEKLRSKRSPQHRSWTDSLMKSFRTSVVDRKLQADSSDRNQVQQCLYTLQRAMKVISQQSLLERLEGVARHQGLTFDVSGSDPPCITLQADMFYIEIVLIKGGGVQEVKIAHQGDATICSELTDILSRGDFPEFTSHLEGLQSIYGVTGEKKLKSKVFLALQSLEKDLNDLAQFQSSISGVANYIHKSPVGILLPRTAGKPMKLIYFVSPYDLLDKKTMSAHPMTVEAITEHGLGRSVTVCLEPGPANKLQTMPLLSVSKSLPSFNGLTHANSANLPACFVLVLPQPIPVAMSVMQNIQNLTKLDTGKDNGSQPLLSLILDSNSGGKMKNDQQLFVSLPDQHHRYFINGVSGGILEEPGVMLSRIPFSHPTHVPKILNFLRQQLLFNSLLASCVRPAAKKDSSSSLVFEMTVISLTQMMVVFEHPAHDTMVTADIDMSDLTNLRCHMLCTNEEHRLCSDDNASLILQRCLSLPILLRSLVRKGRSQLEKLMAEAKALAEEQARLAQEAALWAAAQRQQQAHMPPNIPTKGRPPPPQPPPPQLTPSYPPTPSPITSNPPSVGELHRMTGAVDYLNSSPPGYPVSAPGVDESQDKKNSPLLVNLLDSERGHCGPSLTAQLQQQSQQLPQGVISDSPMLSKLLEDNISVATNITPVSSSQAMLPQPQQMKTKGNKGRKRRMQGELQAGRSPKQRVSDSDASERYGSIDFESSSSPFESSLGSGSMTSFHHPMGPMPSRPPSQGTMSGIIDLTEENMPESSLKKLVDMSSRDMKPGATPTESELHMLLSQQDHNNSPSAGMKPNQMSGSKNENASTSPEGLLTGSGEVGKASLPDPAAMYSSKGRSSSRSSPPAAVAAFLGHGQGPATAPRDSENPGFHQQPAGGLAPQQELTTIAQQLLSGSMACVGVTGAPAASAMAVPRPKVVSSSSMTEALDIKPSVTATKKQSGLKTPPSADYVDKRGLFEKFDFTGQSATSPHVTITSTTIPTTGVMEGEDLIAPKVRLKLHPFRTPQGKSQSLDSGVVQSPSSAGSKSSNSNTFDFRSDEDDDEPVSINYVPSERHAVFSSSPTRLQITSKSKLSTPVSTPETPPPAVKPEKYKRRDKSSGTTKRKKDRDESKKEKKKKKFEHDLYHSSGKEPVYRASTVESDQKSGTKLKIRVSKEHIKMPSPSKESGRMDLNSEKVGKFSEKVNDVFKKRSSTSSPTLEKLVLQKQDIKDHSGADRDAAQLYRSALSASSKSLQKTVHSGKGMVSGSNNTLSKSDPKLAKATIRLKPLNISSSTSTSVTVTPSVKTLSSGRSISERRSQSSSSAAVTTPTSSTMSLASILPNAPTASSVASLPPIPKRPKVSTVNATASAATTITTSAKPSAPVANNINRNLSVNSSYNNAANKMSGNSPGIGGRSGSNLNTSSAHKPPGMGYNKTGSPAGILKTSSNMPGHKISKNTGMPQGILKNSGNVSQGSTNSVKINTAGNQGVQKSSGGSNQLSNNSYNRGPGSTNPAGPQKTALSGHGVSKNLTSQSGNAFKGSGIQGNLSRGQGNQSFQKGPMPSQGGVHKSNMVNQGEAIRNSSSPSQNMGSQKMGSQGKISSANTVNAMHRNLSQGGNLAQGSSNSAGTKLASALPANSVGAGPNQKLAGGQARSLPSGGGCSSSPSTTSRPAVNMRNNSVSGSGGGSPRVPPNHLPVNRSMSLPGQKTGSGSNPRTPSNLSPSNPSAPRFPGQPSQQKNPGSSPSGSTPRSSSTVQTSGQRSNSSSSQNGSNPRSSSNSSQRPSTSSPQTQRPSSASLGSSPTQRPASTPSLATDVRPPSTGATQTPGYPVRPSSAGPRQGSSPLGSRQTSSPGQRLSSSPSGSRTSSPNSQAQRGGGGGASAGVSPLATSRQSPTGPLDVVSVSRPNSSGSVSSATSRPSSTGHVNSPVVSRQNTSGIVNRTPVTRPGSAGSQDPPVTSKLNCSTSEGSLGVSGQTSNSIYTAGSAVSRQSSAAGSNTTVVSRQNSSCGVNATQVSQQSSTKTTPALLRQSSSGNLNSSSSAVFRQNSSSTGGASVAPSSRQSLATDSKTVSAPSVSRLVSSSSVSVAMSRQTDATSGTTSTSGKQLSSGSTASSSANVSTSRTSGAVTSSAQRTSSGSSVGIAGGSKSVVTKPSLNGASGSKTNSGGGGAVSKGASAGKTNATTTSIAGSKTPPTNVVRSPLVSVASSIASITASKGEACSSNSESSASPINSFISGSRAHNTTSFTTSAKLSTSTSSVSSLLSSSLPGHLASSANKTVSSGAARGRKGSLSAIVDKLATKVSASSVPALDNGESLGIGGGGPSVVSMSEGSAERRKNAMEEGEAAEQKTGVKRSASLSGLSPPSSEQKLPRVESHKPASMAGAPLPAHTTPPHSSPSLPTALPGMERHPSGAVAEKNNPFHSRDCADIGLDLSMPKDKVRLDAFPASSLPSHVDAKGRISPKDSNINTVSPGGSIDRGGTKFNGDSNRDRSRSENDIFKVPTPKTQCSEEVEERSSGCGSGRPVSSSNSHPLSASGSPLSDASSSGDDLIIDCGGESPNLATSRPASSASSRGGTPSIHPSPKRVADLASEGTASGGLDRASPGKSVVKTSPSSNVRGFKNSPQSSPHPKLSSNQTSPDPAVHEVHVNSPCEIDDELMNEALGFNPS